MIVTVTPNPSLDLTYVVSALGDVEVHRAEAFTVEPSGKGVNVSRALHQAGAPTTAVVPVAGATGEHLLALLTADGVPYRPVPVAGDTRLNTTVLEPGHTLKVNAPGTVLSPQHASDIVEAVSELLAGVATGAAARTWLVICGSLPPGATTDLVAQLVATGHARGARVAVDTSGPALAAAVGAGADLASPNLRELADINDAVRKTADNSRAVTDPDVLRAVTRFADVTGTELLLSAGAAGAVWTDGSAAVHAEPPPVTPVNTAGAGDGLLAGWLCSSGTPEERLARAVSWGTATCLSPTTVCPDVVTAARAHQVHVHRLDGADVF
ncbi:MAG: 1-phosphofructokinase family hexose kinase [Actinomycetota bacterium]